MIMVINELNPSDGTNLEKIYIVLHAHIRVTLKYTLRKVLFILINYKLSYMHARPVTQYGSQNARLHLFSTVPVYMHHKIYLFFVKFYFMM